MYFYIIYTIIFKNNKRIIKKKSLSYWLDFLQVEKKQIIFKIIFPFWEYKTIFGNQNKIPTLFLKYKNKKHTRL